MLLVVASTHCAEQAEEPAAPVPVPVTPAPPPEAPPPESEAPPEGAVAPGSKLVPLDRLLTVREKTAREIEGRHLPEPPSKRDPGRDPRGEKRVPVSPSMSVERTETGIPGQGVESRDVRGGVTVGEKKGPKLTVEGGVRERQRAEQEDVEPERQATGGVRIEVPFPVGDD
jgi:hypothetical protein